jgi:hypothetical protein
MVGQAEIEFVLTAPASDNGVVVFARVAWGTVGWGQYGVGS